MRKSVDWSVVERLQRDGFEQGRTFSSEEMRLMEQALKEDPQRYREFSEKLRSDYRDRFKC